MRSNKWFQPKGGRVATAPLVSTQPPLPTEQGKWDKYGVTTKT